MMIDVIQHAPFEGIGLIAKWAEERGFTLRCTKLFLAAALPDPETVTYLILMGGPMSANDPLDWLAEERSLLASLLKKRRPIVGICLGAQQLAKVLGAVVGPSPKEVGWAAVKDSVSQAEYTVLHWHGEGFSLPPGSTQLFYSSAWENQGFRYQRSIGLQFHPEADADLVTALTRSDRHFISGSVLQQTATEIVATVPDPATKELLFSLLDSLLEADEND